MVGLLVLVCVFAVCYVIIRVVLNGTQAPTEERHKWNRAIEHYGKAYPFSEINEDPNFPHVRTIRTKIRGVSKRNPDGASRQTIIRDWCSSGDALYLIREPRNPVDPNAIQVRRIVRADLPDKPRLGEQLGYVSRDLAEKLAPEMDEGFVLFAQITAVTGGDDGRSFGVNVRIEEYEPMKQQMAASQSPGTAAWMKKKGDL